MSLYWSDAPVHCELSPNEIASLSIPPWHRSENPLDLRGSRFGSPDDVYPDPTANEMLIIRRGLKLPTIRASNNGSLRTFDCFTAFPFQGLFLSIAVRPFFPEGATNSAVLSILRTETETPLSLAQVTLRLVPEQGTFWDPPIKGQTFDVNCDMTYFVGLVPGVAYRFEFDESPEKSAEPAPVLTGTIRR